MKFLLSTLLILFLGYMAGMLLPWWSIAIVAFLVALIIPMHTGKSFLSGFTGIFLLWAIIATWIDIRNESILSGKIANLIPLGGSSVLLVIVSAIIGALVGGFAAMSGSLLRKVF